MALQCNHAAAIEAYGTLLALLSDAQRNKYLIHLLIVEDVLGKSGLSLALQNNHAAAIEAYGTLLALLPEANRAALQPDLVAATEGIRNNLNPTLQKAYDDVIDKVRVDSSST